MHEIAQDIRNQLFNGMPRWLALRMKAWHQVTESRRDRFWLAEHAKRAEPDDAAFAAAPSPSASSSASFQEWDGRTPVASSNGHAPAPEGPP